MIEEVEFAGAEFFSAELQFVPIAAGYDDVRFDAIDISPKMSEASWRGYLFEIVGWR